MMRAVSALALAAAFALVPADVRAGGIDELHAFVDGAKNGRATFRQTVVARSGRVPQVSSGTFAFSRPGRFRWSYDKPYEQLIVADGARLVLYDRDLNQVTVRKLGASLPSSPASILFGSNDFEKEFEVTDAGARDGLEWVQAKPRAKDSTFERIEIGFRDGLPQAMRLADNFGQVTQLTFAKVERNPKLDAGAFTFTPPKGADVLTE